MTPKEARARRLQDLWAERQRFLREGRLTEYANALIRKRRAFAWDLYAALEGEHVPAQPANCLGLREDDPAPRQRRIEPYFRPDNP